MHLRLLSVSISALVLAGCGDYKTEQFVDINPSETAFVIPVEEGTKDQAKFESSEFLENRKVSTKRVSLSLRKRSTGWLWLSYDWLATDRVIKVDRAQVAREWTEGSTPGSPTPEGFHIESLDAIGFAVGGALICHIDEQDAAKHLYHFGGRSLKEVMDTAMRTWLLGQLSQKFSVFTLTECIAKKVQFFKEVEAEAKIYWKERGVTVDSFSMSEGITYDNAEVQKTLDAKFVAENDVLVQRKMGEAQTEKNLVEISKRKGEADATASALRAKAENDAAIAEAELKAQLVRNKLNLDKADNDAKVAAIYASAKEGIMVQVEADVRRILANAQKTFAEKWLGSLPASLLPANSPLLLNLGQQQDAQVTAPAAPVTK